MQMQKKITVKDDGRFLAYYHFPATATPEETEVFEEITPLDAEQETGSKGQTIVQESAANTQAAAASVAPTPATGDTSHV